MEPNCTKKGYVLFYLSIDKNRNMLNNVQSQEDIFKFKLRRLNMNYSKALRVAPPRARIASCQGVKGFYTC